MERSNYYYQAQVTGWALYVLISAVFFILSGTELSLRLIGGIYLVFALGLLVTHLYRFAIIKLRWLEMDIAKLLPRVALACVFMALGFHALYLAIGNFLFSWDIDFRLSDSNLITWGMLFFIWSLIYFIYHFFQRFRQEEIKNLRLEATKNEYELRRLKDQMNPHFIFNAMNTIRALIDEDPKKAKSAVTQLSNVLRSSLQTGKQDLIPLKDELRIVEDYLQIEKARYEERLSVEYQIDPESMNARIPPLMVQTLVENSIKHGISKLPDGGTIKILSSVDGHNLHLSVINSGQMAQDMEHGTMLGLDNTKKRLALSFGDEAMLQIGNHNGNSVKTSLIIPMTNTKKL